VSDAFFWGVLPKIMATALDYADFGLGQSSAPPVKFIITKSKITVGPNQISGALKLPYAFF